MPSLRVSSVLKGMTVAYYDEWVASKDKNGVYQMRPPRTPSLYAIYVVAKLPRQELPQRGTCNVLHPEAARDTCCRGPWP